MTKKSKTGVKKLRSPNKKRANVEEWIQSGDSETENPTPTKANMKKIIPDNIENDGKSSIAAPQELFFQIEDFLTDHRRKTGDFVPRSALIRVWLYALVHAPKFRKKLLKANDENEMLTLILDKLEK